MKEKEKAEQLTAKMFGFTIDECKSNALLCCDEIIKSLDEVSLWESGITKIDYGQNYWNDVKQEIEKL